MTHPDFQRQSVFRRLARFAAESVKDDFEVIIAFQIRQAVMEGMAGAGWRPVENVPILLKVLSLRRALADFWTEPPPPRPSPIESEPDIRAIAPDNFPQLEALSASPSMRQARTSEFLDWRYCRNPHWRYRSDGLFDGTRLRAFVVSRQAMLRGRWTLAIADAGGEASALARLVRHVCARDGAGLGLAAALLSRHHPAYRAMRTSGFVPGPHRFRLLVLGRKQVSGWSISWGDTDHL
jgi:hypothetical protein